MEYQCILIPQFPSHLLLLPRILTRFHIKDNSCSRQKRIQLRQQRDNPTDCKQQNYVSRDIKEVRNLVLKTFQDRVLQQQKTACDSSISLPSSLHQQPKRLFPRPRSNPFLSVTLINRKQESRHIQIKQLALSAPADIISGTSHVTPTTLESFYSGLEWQLLPIWILQALTRRPIILAMMPCTFSLPYTITTMQIFYKE